jgi:hypothetical protein
MSRQAVTVGRLTQEYQTEVSCLAEEQVVNRKLISPSGEINARIPGWAGGVTRKLPSLGKMAVYKRVSSPSR